jgi:hypothetical protein
MVDEGKSEPGPYQPGQLRAFLDAMRSEVGDDKELLKQSLADLNALQRQSALNHFESRIEYSKQVTEHRNIALRALVEYGLQTLKWSFLLNAGAIAIVLTFAGANVAKGTGTAFNAAPLIKALWPFAVGCVCVLLAGAAGFFNFSYLEAAMPSSEALHNFMTPTARTWPLAKMQKVDETPAEFVKRFSWKVGACRNAAILLAWGSAAFFAYGVYRVFRATI